MANPIPIDPKKLAAQKKLQEQRMIDAYAAGAGNTSTVPQVPQTAAVPQVPQTAAVPQVPQTAAVNPIMGTGGIEQNTPSNPITGTSPKEFNYAGLAKGVSQGIGAVSGLANSWLGYKNFKLAEKQSKFEQQAYNTNVETQKKLANQQILDKEQWRAWLNQSKSDTRSKEERTADTEQAAAKKYI